MCVCVCVNGCSPFHVQRSEFYFSGHLSCFCILEMNFAGAFGALQHRLLGRPGWGSLCQARQALPCLVGVLLTALCCVTVTRGHELRVSAGAGTRASNLAVCTGSCSGGCGQPSSSTQHLVGTSVTWLVTVLQNLKYNKSLLSFSLTLCLFAPCLAAELLASSPGCLCPWPCWGCPSPRHLLGTSPKVEETQSCWSPALSPLLLPCRAMVHTVVPNGCCSSTSKPRPGSLCCF